FKSQMQSHKDSHESNDMDIDDDNGELASKISNSGIFHDYNNNYDNDNDNGNVNVDDNEDAIKDIESLRSYHEYILDSILFQCFLKKNQEHIIKDLNEILSIILSFARTLQQRRFRNYNEQQKQEYWSTIKSLYGKFKLYTSNFAR